MRASIESVVHTRLEVIVLVVLVVILFLQTWRASIIPLLAVPVAVVGTFGVMHLFGFSINALSLFGLVLAVGIVVDDAIVVVGNVERNIDCRLTPREATCRAMREVSGPTIAIALVLIAVFVPLALISGLIRQFYRQFALTIAISTSFSAINSLALAPALSALLLKGRDEPKDALTRSMDELFGRFFRAFSRLASARLRSLQRRLEGRHLTQGGDARHLRGARRRHHRRLRAGTPRLRAGTGQAVPDRVRAVARRRHVRPHRRGHPSHERHREEAAERRERDCVPGGSRSTAS